LADVEKWAIECKRILADNGTLLWYGDAKNIAYAQIIFDKYFNLLNSIVWENTNDHKQQIRFNEDLRTFAPLTERILMYTKENEDTGLQVLNNDINNYSEIRDYFNNERKKLGKSLTWINREVLGYNNGKDGMAGNILSVHKKGWSFPTNKQYLKLQKTGFFKKPYEELKERYKLYRLEYEELRKEYEELRRPFNNYLHLGDVIRLPNYETSDYDHETVKPEKLTRILINTCSRVNDLVIVPFAGSGTECAMSVKEGRRFIGFEITEKHAKMSNDRVQKILKQPSLF
jgi:DNA modification methylase